MGTAGAQPDGAKRILAHLEHGARLPASKPGRSAGWAFDGWTVGLGLLLLVMCGIAWLMHDRTVTPAGFKAGYSGTRNAPRYERKERIQATRDTRAAPDEVSVEPTEQAAAIVNDPTPPQATGETAVMPAALASQATAYTPPARSAGATTTTSTTEGPRVAAINKYNTTGSAGAAAARAQATTATASRGKVTPANDTDVALLTALVAHAGKPSVVTPERSRDIVERHEGDSTADLLARCKQLGLIEGMLCRSRICSGRWETDATCRAPAL